MSTALYSYPDVFPITQDLSGIVAGTSGSVGVVVGASDRGPINTRTPITSTRVLTSLFGNPNILTSYVHHTVMTAMEEMALVYVTRVPGTDCTMAAVGIGPTTGYTNTYTDGIPYPFVDDTELFSADVSTCVVFFAQNPGVWGNNISVYIDNVTLATDSAPDNFNITIYENVNGVNIIREKWINVSTYQTIPGTTMPNLDGYGRSAFVENVINLSSLYLNCAVNANADSPTPVATLNTSTLTTTAATASGSVLTFASTSGVVLGQTVSGTNISPSTTVISKTSTTITMSNPVNGNVASGATITLSSPGTPISLTGGTNGNAVSEAQVSAGWNLYSDPNTILIDLLLNAGYVTDSTFGVQSAMDALATSRQDCFSILDVPYDQQSMVPSTLMTNWRTVTQNFNTSFSALYAGWPLCYDSLNDIHGVPLPVSGFAGQVYARRDLNQGATWYAPAGLQDGLISSGIYPVEGLSVYYDGPTQGLLYQVGINYVRMFIGGGYALWGQKTLQSIPSALDRINVRRLVIAIVGSVRNYLLTQVFELNNTFTQQVITANLTQYMQAVQSNNGVFAFAVICNSSNNTAQDIDNNTLNVEIRIQPQKTAEFIVFTTTIEKTGSDLTVSISNATATISQ